MAVTRIKNNQIIDSGIWANSKIIPGSITGDLFNSNITVTSDFTITGNLTVQGGTTTFTVASTNTYINDPLIVLNNAFSGTNTYDLGFVFERGSLVNQAIIWDESEDTFKMLATTETGDTYGDINETSLSNLTVGNLTAQYGITAQSITITDAEGINISGNVSGGLAEFAAINNTPIGNATPSTGAFTTLDASGVVNFAGNVSAGTLIAATVNTTGNVSASQVSSATLKASGLTAGRVVHTGTDGLLIDNQGLLFATNTLTVGENITANAAGWIGTATGDLTLAAAGDVDFNGSNGINLADPVSGQDAVTLSYLNSSLSSDVTTIQQDDTFVKVTDSGSNGNIVIDADGERVGLITQDTTEVLNNLDVSNATPSTSATTGAIVTAGGIGATGNVVTAGQVKSSADFESDSVTTGAIITAGGVGIAKNLNVGGDMKVFGNLIVEGEGTVINGGVLEVEDKQITVAKGAGTSAAADGAGLNVDYANVGANITYTHATTSWNFNRTVIVESVEEAADFEQGAFRVYGGASIDGALYVGSGLQKTDIGNVTPATGAFTTLDASGVVNFAGNLSAGLVSTGSLNSTGYINTTGNVSGAVGNFGALNISDAVVVGSINTAGNVLAAGGIFNALTVNGDVTATGDLAVTGDVDGGLATFASINGTPIGNATPSTGAFTTINASGFVNLAGNVNALGMNTGTLDTTGVVTINDTTEATSTLAGSLITAGGIALAKSVFAGIGGTFNSTKVATTFLVKGQGNDQLFKIDTAKNAAVMSTNGNAIVQDGTIMKFDSTGAILLPKGANGSRPGASANVAVAGMLRYSTTNNGIEFYDGSEWKLPGTTFTVAASDQFAGDGSTVAFTLGEAATTASTIVSINGIVQIPTTAYAVSSTTLTFTEAPAVGDVIDARRLITTSSISELSNADSSVQYQATEDGYANIQTDSTTRLSIGPDGTATFENDVIVKGELSVLGDSSGNINIGDEAGDKVQLTGTIVYNETPTNQAGGNMVVIDSFATAAYHSAKYFVQIRDGFTSSIQSQEILLTNDDGAVNHTVYGVVSPEGDIGTFVSNISGSNAQLIMIPANADVSANIKAQTTYIV